MNKPREFYIRYPFHYRTDHILTEEEGETYGLNNYGEEKDEKWFKVREVNPELDAAYEECVKALEEAREIKPWKLVYEGWQHTGDCDCKICEALEAWRKANE